MESHALMVASNDEPCSIKTHLTTHVTRRRCITRILFWEQQKIVLRPAEKLSKAQHALMNVKPGVIATIGVMSDKMVKVGNIAPEPDAQLEFPLCMKIVVLSW